MNTDSYQIEGNVQGPLQFKIIVRYLALLAVLDISTGFILGLIRRVVMPDHPQHSWGVWDSDLATRTIETVLVCFAVYWRLAKEQPRSYFKSGLVIAGLNGVLNFLVSLVGAPSIRVSALAISVSGHIVIFLLASAVFHFIFRDRSAGEPDHVIRK